MAVAAVATVNEGDRKRHRKRSNDEQNKLIKIYMCDVVETI